MLDKRSDIEVVVRNMDTVDFKERAAILGFFADLGYDWHGIQVGLPMPDSENVFLFRKRTKGQP